MSQSSHLSRQVSAGAGHRERGVSLIIVLIVLTIVSLVGVAGIQVATMSERSARNDRDQQMAWQSAEAALLDAELDIIDPAISSRNTIFSQGEEAAFLSGCGTAGNSRGLCALVSAGKPAWLTVDFTDTSAGAATTEYGAFTNREFKAGAAGVQPARAPRYVIEPIVDYNGGGESRNLSNSKPRYVYRVTAMGYGPRADIQAVLQMSFRN
jgi:type IV pilus assembly protein PilX